MDGDTHIAVTGGLHGLSADIHHTLLTHKTPTLHSELMTSCKTSCKQGRQTLGIHQTIVLVYWNQAKQFQLTTFKLRQHKAGTGGPLYNHTNDEKKNSDLAFTTQLKMCSVCLHQKQIICENEREQLTHIQDWNIQHTYVTSDSPVTLTARPGSQQQCK